MNKKVKRKGKRALGPTFTFASIVKMISISQFKVGNCVLLCVLKFVKVYLHNTLMFFFLKFNIEAFKMKRWERGNVLHSVV